MKTRALHRFFKSSISNWWKSQVLLDAESLQVLKHAAAEAGFLSVCPPVCMFLKFSVSDQLSVALCEKCSRAQEGWQFLRQLCIRSFPVHKFLTKLSCAEPSPAMLRQTAVTQAWASTSAQRSEVQKRCQPTPRRTATSAWSGTPTGWLCGFSTCSCLTLWHWEGVATKSPRRTMRTSPWRLNARHQYSLVFVRSETSCCR